MTYRLAILIGLVLGLLIGWAAIALTEPGPARRNPVVIGVRHA